mgnify:CR=1 FL=1
MKNQNSIFIAVAIVLGLGVNGYFIGSSIERFNKENRYFSVKGFSEKEVKANFAVWTIKIKITTNDILEGSKEIENNKAKILSFLLENNFKQDEIVQQSLNVTDKFAREYGDAGNRDFRYIIENSLQVRSTNVDNIQKVSRMTDKLLKIGIIISNEEYNPAVQFLFTNLNGIKPEMLSEATNNARKAALEFARQSNVSLGNIRKASQGVFSIIDRDDYNSGRSEDGGGYASNNKDIFKKVKVVVNIEYSIK